MASLATQYRIQSMLVECMYGRKVTHYTSQIARDTFPSKRALSICWETPFSHQYCSVLCCWHCLEKHPCFLIHETLPWRSVIWSAVIICSKFRITQLDSLLIAPSLHQRCSGQNWIQFQSPRRKNAPNWQSHRRFAPQHFFCIIHKWKWSYHNLLTILPLPCNLSCTIDM